jgi:hypothetical protein
VSGVDGNVTIDPSSSNLLQHHAIPAADIPIAGTGLTVIGRPLEGDAQRFAVDFDDRSQVNLIVPASRPSAGIKLLENAVDSKLDVSWMRVAPLHRVSFEPTEPFVFEDNLSAYWVTYEPIQLQFSVPGFWSWVAANSDLKLAADKTPAVPSIDFKWFESSDDAQQKLGSAVRLLIEGAGTKLRSYNGFDTTLRTSDAGSKAGYDVVGADGSTLYKATAGALYRDTQIVTIKETIVARVLGGDSLVSDGHFVLTLRLPRWRFETFYHPHVSAMRETLNRLGVFGLVDPPADATPREALDGQDPVAVSPLASRYTTTAIRAPLPADDLDFSAGGAHAQYNWEIFFHAPFLIASRLHEGRGGCDPDHAA